MTETFEVLVMSSVAFLAYLPDGQCHVFSHLGIYRRPHNINSFPSHFCIKIVLHNDDYAIYRLHILFQIMSVQAVVYSVGKI